MQMTSTPKYVLTYGIGVVYDVQACSESLSHVRYIRRTILENTKKEVPYLEWKETTYILDNPVVITDFKSVYKIIECWESNREPEKDYMEIQEWTT